MVEMVQKEDAATWRTLNLVRNILRNYEIIFLLSFQTSYVSSQQMGIGLRKLDAIREQSYKAFEENMPVGLKTMINDEAHDL